MVFKSVEELKQYVLSRSSVAVQKATEEAYQVIDRFVKQFYGELSPSMYRRTYQLYSSLVKTGVESTGSGWVAHVYFDIGSLVYTTRSKPSGAQVMRAAAHGGHGAQGLHVIAGGTAIWDEPIQILSTEAIEILKRMLIHAGIPIK